MSAAGAGGSAAGASSTGGAAGTGAGGASGGSGGNAGGSGGASGTGGTGGAACVAPPSPPVFEVGTGESCFTRLTPGQTVKVENGPQGGFHIWLALGCTDCGATPIVQFGIKDPATSDYYPMTMVQKQVVPLDGAWPQRAGLTAFLPGMVWDKTSQLPMGTHVLLSGAVLDASGAVLHSSDVEVVLGDIEQWNPPCSTDPGCGAPGGLPCCTG